jgi:hypothetical protein
MFGLFDLRPCQHDNGYLDGRSHIKVHTDERTQVHSAQSSLAVTHPGATRARRSLTSVTESPSKHCVLCICAINKKHELKITRRTVNNKKSFSVSLLVTFNWLECSITECKVHTNLQIWATFCNVYKTARKCEFVRIKFV